MSIERFSAEKARKLMILDVPNTKVYKDIIDKVKVAAKNNKDYITVSGSIDSRIAAYLREDGFSVKVDATQTLGRDSGYNTTVSWGTSLNSDTVKSYYDK